MYCLAPVAAWRVGRTDSGKEKLSFKVPSYIPFASPTYMLPCGKCELCLERKRQDWIRRLELESFLHDSSSFVTLTYNDQYLPDGGVASKSDLQKFIKRLRNVPRDFNVSFGHFKYFFVSEYGSKHGRPHYHGLIFGLDFMSDCWRPYFATLKDGRHPVYSSSVLDKVWRFGFVSVDRLTPANISYVCKYVNKDLDKKSFRLFSRGFGKSIFFDDNNRLTSFGRSSYENGFVVYPFGNDKFFRGAIPKNIDRYLSLYADDVFQSVKLSRRKFSQGKFISSCELNDRKDIIKIRRSENSQKRILDNET